MLGPLAVVSGTLEFIVAFWFWRKLVDFEEVLTLFYELVLGVVPIPFLLYSRTEIIMDIRWLDRRKRIEDCFSQFFKFLEELVAKPLIELLPALFRGVQLW